MLDMKTRPSDLLGIEDSYTAFCFDEACAFIINQIKEGKEPIIKRTKNEMDMHVNKPSDIYKHYNQ